MIAQTGTLAPASQTAERDARAINAGDGHVRPSEIAIGVVIGRTSEFFDFFVYAIASVLVFPALVFPYVDRLTGTFYSFGIFALAFIARPVGSLIFLRVDEVLGRGTKLTIALFLLGGSTASVAFLPGYDTIGNWSVILLALFRLGQGIALGGAWDGLASLLALNAPKEKRGWYAMIPQLGAPLGLIVASGLFAFFLLSLSTADFLDWGWRYPFFVAFAINVVALFARLRMVTTPDYTALFESRDLEPSRVADTLRSDWRNIVIGAFAPLASFALFHMVTVFRCPGSCCSRMRTPRASWGSRSSAGSSAWSRSSPPACSRTGSAGDRCSGPPRRASRCSAGSRRNCWMAVARGKSSSWSPASR